MEAYLVDALKISELEVDLETIANDDGKEITDYSLGEVVSEARWVLSNYRESGHSLNEDLRGDHGRDERKKAFKEVKALERFIKKYSGKAATK